MKRDCRDQFPWAGLIITILLFAECGERPAIEGTCQTVTESESNLALNLNRSGVAVEKL